jgi:hypothetical protein
MAGTRRTISPEGLLCGTWLACFAICMLLPWVSFLQSNIEMDTLEKALTAVSDVYSANLAVILGFFFHQRIKTKRGTVAESAKLVGLAATLLWNIFVVGCFAATVTNALSTTQATMLASQIAPKLSWLVAPLLGYFFAAPKAAEA